jgi:hypothetical protein
MKKQLLVLAIALLPLMSYSQGRVGLKTALTIPFSGSASIKTSSIHSIGTVLGLSITDNIYIRSGVDYSGVSYSETIAKTSPSGQKLDPVVVFYSSTNLSPNLSIIYEFEGNFIQPYIGVGSLYNIKLSSSKELTYVKNNISLNLEAGAKINLTDKTSLYGSFMCLQDINAMYKNVSKNKGVIVSIQLTRSF